MFFMENQQKSSYHQTLSSSIIDIGVGVLFCILFSRIAVENTIKLQSYQFTVLIKVIWKDQAISV